MKLLIAVCLSFMAKVDTNESFSVIYDLKLEYPDYLPCGKHGQCQTSCFRDGSCIGYEMVGMKCILKYNDYGIKNSTDAWVRGRIAGRQISCKKDCQEWLEAGYSTDGTYKLCVGGSSFQAFCDLTTDGGGWTVIQRRVDDSVDFERGFDEYSVGFGDLEGNHWLGLNYMHTLTEAADSELRIDIEIADGTKYYAKYGTFSISSSPDFILTTSEYTGTAGDGFTGEAGQNQNVNGKKFTTFDRDADLWQNNCAATYRGGWWFRSCGFTLLNAPYTTPGTKGSNTIHWGTSPIGFAALKSASMMMRRK